jgi:hypothetical protein
MKSRGFHLRLRCAVSRIAVFGRDWVGVGVMVYNFPLSMLVASGRVVSILCVWVLGPYAWVRVLVRVLLMCVASSCVSAFEFATRYICRLYLGRCWVVCVCVWDIVAMC